MNAIPVRERYKSRLPATPCTMEMRDSIKKIAQKQGITIAEVQRFALDFFLTEYVSKYSNGDNIVDQKEVIAHE